MASQLDINKIHTILTTGNEETKLVIYTAIYNITLASNKPICAELNELAPFDMSLYKRYESSLNQSKQKFLAGMDTPNEGVYFDKDSLGAFGLNPTVIEGVYAVNAHYELYREAHAILSKL